jgi:hypothetical protein
MKLKVLAVMKPKVASLGFTTEELEGVAATIAGNLLEDATEEQINSAIDGALPLLKLSQSAVNRIVNAAKKKAKTEEKPEENPLEEKPEEEAPAWAKGLMKDIADLKSEKLSTSRLSKFQEVIKDLPAKQKEFMSLGFNPALFKDDEEFEAHIQKIQVLVPDIIQEQANDGLGKMGKPGGGGDTKTEAEDFAKKMAEINKTE